jgi:hypothetical protein
MSAKETAAHDSPSLGESFVLKRLKRVPHTLFAEPKRTKVDLECHRLQHLSSARHQGCGHLLRGEDSWFYLNTDYERI